MKETPQPGGRRNLGILSGVAVALGIAYVAFFTDWISPEPIVVSSQVRPVIQQPRFNRRVRLARPPAVAAPADARGDVLVRTTDGAPTPPDAASIVNGMPPEENRLADAPNGVAHVTFRLDGRFSLTSLRVFAEGPDGAPGKMMWNLSGKSRPLDSLIYGRPLPGMSSATGEDIGTPLEPGVKYRLEIASGRRKGTNWFQTVPRAPAPE
jgi:hypothetical protein